ncbi:hypothetical protein AB751O23_AP_00110 [Chlamydiales bacterium SCGC AB-751-O23]|jgi:hypothetical protein|nr:hypothetical protein AB751O23_AP_00110 [Chlamydiales bacterium SCGC AB-751-O23]
MSVDTMVEIEETVDGFVQEVLIKGNLELIEFYISPDVKIHSLVGVKGQGIACAIKTITSWSNSFDVLENELLFSTKSEGRVTNHWRVKAILKNNLLGVKAKNDEVNFSGLTMYEVNQGKITSIWSYSDFHISSLRH